MKFKLSKSYIILISVLSLLLIWLTHIIQHACMPWDKINQKRSNQ